MNLLWVVLVVAALVVVWRVRWLIALGWIIWEFLTGWL